MTSLLLVALVARPVEPQPMFNATFQSGRLTSLVDRSDASNAEYLDPKSPFGEVTVAYRQTGQTWKKWSSQGKAGDGDEKHRQHSLTNGLVLETRFTEDDKGIHWKVALRNTSSKPVEVGSLGTPANLAWSSDSKDGHKNYFLQHLFVSGASSFVFWNRSSCQPPELLLLPDAGTAPEYWDGEWKFTLYFLSQASGEANQAKGTKWRVPQTSMTLAPGATRSFGYTLKSVKGTDQLRQSVVDNGGIDVEVFPGMTLPVDMTAQVAIRTHGQEPTLEAEHPKSTTLRRAGKRGDYVLFDVHFDKLGENRLAVHHSAGTTYLEFFATEPVETLIAKRAAFIAAHQIKDKTKWYDGLLAEWNNATQTTLSPDNYDKIKGWRIYEVTCDDPGLSKPAFLAAKIAEFPTQAEVDALDTYIDRFVWGGLQQTDKEPRPYAIYGIPDWHVNRNKTGGKPRDGVDHVWRCYDYPHIVLMYERMYKAARSGAVKTALPAKTYLERAYHTAVAMHTIPMEVEKWSAVGTGFYNECSFLDLIDDLRAEGMAAEADKVKGLWETKVRHFTLDAPDLFQSEYAFDSTGFESTAYLARYAVDHGKDLGLPADEVRTFLEKQLAANLFCRGCVEPAYYYLGSDYRGQGGKGFTLTYMSQMGGHGVMDYGLYDAQEPWRYLRLGMNSYLSAWALVNSGTAASDYGYWYPGKANDGASAGGFEPAPFGTTWLEQPHHRGPWYYSCESDLGFCGALRSARTLLVDDPVFGRVCMGGTFTRPGDDLKFTSRDGVRRRLSVRLRGWAVDAELTGLRLSAVGDSRLTDDSLDLALDGSGPGTVSWSSLSDGHYELSADGAVLRSWRQDGRAAARQAVPAGARRLQLRRIRDL